MASVTSIRHFGMVSPAVLVYGECNKNKADATSRIKRCIGHMLPQNLTTNEVKNEAGGEIEFSRRNSGPGMVEFQHNGEEPAYPHRLVVSHQEIGEGVNRRRRSRVGFKRFSSGEIDTTRRVSIDAYVVLDIPVGNIESYNNVKTVLAELISFVASTGADTAIKYDCSGHGAAALLNGTT